VRLQTEGYWQQGAPAARRQPSSPRQSLARPRHARQLARLTCHAPARPAPHCCTDGKAHHVHMVCGGLCVNTLVQVRGTISAPPAAGETRLHHRPLRRGTSRAHLACLRCEQQCTAPHCSPCARSRSLSAQKQTPGRCGWHASGRALRSSVHAVAAWASREAWTPCATRSAETALWLEKLTTCACCSRAPAKQSRLLTEINDAVRDSRRCHRRGCSVGASQAPAGQSAGWNLGTAI